MAPWLYHMINYCGFFFFIICFDLLCISIPPDVYLSCFWTHIFWRVFNPLPPPFLIPCHPATQHALNGGRCLSSLACCVYTQDNNVLSSTGHKRWCLLGEKGLRAKNGEKTLLLYLNVYECSLQSICEYWYKELKEEAFYWTCTITGAFNDYY